MTSPPDGSGGDGSTAVPSAELWTLREGVQGIAPCAAAPSTPPCFDRNAEEQQQQQQQQQQHAHRHQHLLSARGRAGSFDNARSTNGDDEDNRWSSSSSLSSSYRAMMAARKRSSSTGNFAGFSSAPGDCERFPPLLRRRTFTEPSRTKSRCLDDGEEEELASASASAAAAGRNRSGRVPTSMSEDNMLNLLSSHRDRITPATTTLPGRSLSVRPHLCLSEAETPSTELHAHVLEATSSSVGGGGGGITTSVRVGTSSSTSTSSDESIGNGGVGSEGAVGGTVGTTETTATTTAPMQLEEMEEHPPPPSPLPAADSRARGGNAFMLRLHRAGLMEDTSRCVMDIVEGRAAAAPNAGSSQAAHYGAAVAPTAAPAVTLEDVKEHLRSLPERYALTVSPEDVLDHMALFAAVSAAAAETATQKHASSTSSASAQEESLGAEPPTVRVVARPSPLALSSSHPAAAGDGEGGVPCGSGLAGVGRAYSLTVACRQSPLLLGAISSSLRSAGASCLDVDVVSTTRTTATRSYGLSLARLEVRVIGGPGLTAASSAAAEAAAAAGAGGTAASSSASASGWRRRSSAQRGEMEEEKEEEEEEEEEGEMPRRLEGLLSSSIAAALLLAGDEGEGRSGQEEEDEEEEEDGAGEREGDAVSPEPPPAGDKRERFGRGGQAADGAAHGDGGGGGGGDGQRSDGGVSRSQPLATTTPWGGTTAAAARRAQVTSSSVGTADCAGVGGTAQCAGGTVTPAGGTATAAAGGGASDSNSRCCSSSSSRGRRRGNREPLARRQGCFFLAEADANALGSNGNSDASHFGGGGGGGAASCAKSLGNSSTSNNNATSNNNNNNNNNNSNGNSKNGANDSTVFSPCTRSEIGNDGDSTHGGDCRYSTIPPEDIELLELAGRGRFSRTYRARWRGSTVAVKTLELPPEVDREHEAAGAEIVGDGDGSRAVVVAEFERELHIVSNLRHPNVCGFRGVSVSLPHHLSLVYDFLDNGTLGDRLRDTASSGSGSGSGSSSSVHGRGGGGGVGGEREWGSRRDRGSEPLTSTDLLRIVTDVVNGMLYLHELGVMHRDLKPDNILLDADDRAVIADFGLSRFSHPTNDHTAETGTYRWMAPEVIRHEPYSQAADVYSFGVVLWQVVARKQPFKGLTPLQAAFSVARQGLRPQIPPSAPPAVARLIRRCWHRSPDSRPSFSQIRSELPEIERQMLSL